jgi:hypothetical protein
LCIGPGGGRSAEQGFEVVFSAAPRGGAQRIGFATHLQRRVQHRLHFREGAAQQLALRQLAFADDAALLPGPGIQADELQRSQRHQADAHRSPAGAEKAARQVAQRQRAAVVCRQLELTQIPQRACRLQRALGLGEYGYAGTKPTFRGSSGGGCGGPPCGLRTHLQQ